MNGLPDDIVFRILLKRRESITSTMGNRGFTHPNPTSVIGYAKSGEPLETVIRIACLLPEISDKLMMRTDESIPSLWRTPMSKSEEEFIMSRRDFLKFAAGAAISPTPAKSGDTHSSSFRVGILKHTSFSAAPDVYTLYARRLKSVNFHVTFISPSEMIDKKWAQESDLDCLILTDSPHCPGACFSSIRDFLGRGKHLILLGGKAFSDPTILAGNQLLTRTGMERLLSSTPVNHLFFDFSSGDLSAWGHNTNKPEHGSKLLLADAPFGKCVELDIKNIGEWQWDTYAASLPSPFPLKDNLFCFQAKGGPLSPQLVVEMDEKDGSRWVATVDITVHWRRYALQEGDFHFLKDASPQNRGGEKDHLYFQNAARVSFGLATGLARYHYGDNVIWIGEIGAAKTDMPLGDTVFPDKPELPLFGDYEPYDLTNAVSASSYVGQHVLPKNIRILKRLSGTSAVGFGLANKSSFTPLLEAKDANGEYRGWVLGMMVNYGGEYKGSSWIFSGVTSQSLYRDPVFIGVLIGALKRIRGADLVDETAKRAKLEKIQIPILTSPAPEGFLRISKDRHSFIKPDGAPLFMTGCNYLGRENRFCQLTPSSLEEDFRRAHLAGINVFRIWVGCSDPDGRHRDAIRECARKYGIYLIHQIGAVGENGDDVMAKVSETATYWRDEPMVLGYDLQNEPYLGTIAPMRFNGKPSPLLQLNPYEKYAPKIDRKWVETQVRQRPAWPQILGSPDEDELKNLYAAYWIFDRWSADFMDSNNDSSTFPRLNGQIPLAGEWADFSVALNETFSQWIKKVGGAVRQADPNHFITVGYNSCLSCLPCNKHLDFVSQHVYEAPTNLSNVLKNVTTMDRLSAAWPNQPVSLGEFGYSNGIQVGNGFLDIYTSSIGEMVHYLHAYSKGYGGCLKWMLIDLPAPIVRDNIPWLTPDNYYEERFGIYWDDGTPQGRPKPIARALAFLRRYAEMSGDRGELEIVASNNAIGTAYRFQSRDAFFIGDTKYDSAFLSFHSHTNKPGNIMLHREGDAIMFLSTVDATVRINPTQWHGSPRGIKGDITGKIGEKRNNGDQIKLEVLEGEVLKIV